MKIKYKSKLDHYGQKFLKTVINISTKLTLVISSVKVGLKKISSRCTTRYIIPSTSMKQIRFWSDYYLRYDRSMVSSMDYDLYPHSWVISLCENINNFKTEKLLTNRSSYQDLLDRISILEREKKSLITNLENYQSIYLNEQEKEQQENYKNNNNNNNNKNDDEDNENEINTVFQSDNIENLKKQLHYERQVLAALQLDVVTNISNEQETRERIKMELENEFKERIEKEVQLRLKNLK
eukprot:TRINITY_DN6206_c0_g4_i1.p2 TRINITY_DN6206_c0_g4~~TRINITY_DN6206_c0_g4_i1.p2  ORF type:complete len:238 (+),score=55.20 TRINITY_DN6206_c0_g4_i1:578-1291(+)